MSTNIHLRAVREILVPKTGKKETQTQKISVWQTPTEVSYQIEKSDDPIAAYKEWVVSVSNDEVLDIYDPDDYFQERKPIGKHVMNEGKEHIERLEQEISQLQSEGFEITVEVW